MSRKDKTPLALKVIRWVFPRLERVAPPLANRYFVKLFFTPLRYRMPHKEKEFFDSAEKFSLTVSQKKVQGYAWGEGPVVMVVHGWAGRATQFRKFIPALNKAGYRVVSFDGPAHGKSEGKRTNIIEFEAVFKTLFEKVGKPVAIIAHSFGGVATLYSITQGLPVEKVVNIATPTIADEIVNTYLRTIGGSPKVREAFNRHMLSTFGKTFNELSALQFVKEFPTPIQLLLVHDKEDEEVTVEHPLALVKHYPKAELFLTSGLGHSRILKDEAVIGRIIDFIGSNN